MSELGKAASARRDWGGEGSDRQPAQGMVAPRASDGMTTRGITAMQGGIVEHGTQPEPKFARAEQPIKDF